MVRWLTLVSLLCAAPLLAQAQAKTFNTKKYHKFENLWQKGKCLDIRNDKTDDQPQLAACGNFTGQFWRMHDAGGGYYRMTTEWRGKKLCLDVVNDAKSNSKLRLQKCSGAAHGQKWMFLPHKKGLRMTNQWRGTGTCIDVKNDKLDRDLKLTWCGKYSGQIWIPKPTNRNAK